MSTVPLATPRRTGAAHRVRLIGFRIITALVALAMALTGGHLLLTGWSDGLDGGVHRVQDLSWGVTEGLLLAVPLGWQLRRPLLHAGAMRVALLAGAAQLICAVAAGQPDPFGVVLCVLLAAAAFLHPARGALLRARPRPDRALLVLAAPAAVALLIFAGAQVGHHYNAGPRDLLEAKTGWLGAAIASTALALTLLAAAVLRSPAAALLTTAGLAVLGTGSLLHPHLASSYGTIGGGLALAGAAALISRTSRTAVLVRARAAHQQNEA